MRSRIVRQPQVRKLKEHLAKPNTQIAAEILAHRKRDLAKQAKKKNPRPQRKTGGAHVLACSAEENFYLSDLWRALRYETIKKYGARCQACGATPKDGTRIHVDHIKPRSKFPELELERSNLQVLCEDCNLGKRHTDFTDWR
jgi:5-methylcytosine-specific restriction endonuclease McrA